MNPDELIAISRGLANGLVSGLGDQARQTTLCRAVSCTYYALFHTLCRCCADGLAGRNRQGQSRAEWHRVYRALQHGFARAQCDNKTMMKEFTQEIQEFGELFVEAQRLRHIADYSPESQFSQNEVTILIDEAELAIAAFNSADGAQRRAFAIHVLFRQRV